MRIPRVLFAAPLLLGAFSLTGCGTSTTTPGAATGSGAPRTVEVTMVDNAFQPAQITVHKGETVTLRFTNTGMTRHEAVLGDDTVQARHEIEMATTTTAAGAMDHGTDTMAPTTTAGMAHGASPGTDNPMAITVEPGQTATLAHTFTETGPVVIGCHQPGHWQAGMKATATAT